MCEAAFSLSTLSQKQKTNWRTIHTHLLFNISSSAKQQCCRQIIKTTKSWPMLTIQPWQNTCVQTTYRRRPSERMWLNLKKMKPTIESHKSLGPPMHTSAMHTFHCWNSSGPPWLRANKCILIVIHPINLGCEHFVRKLAAVDTYVSPCLWDKNKWIWFNGQFQMTSRPKFRARYNVTKFNQI